jgi:hypothetical protein
MPRTPALARISFAAALLGLLLASTLATTHESAHAGDARSATDCGVCISVHHHPVTVVAPPAPPAVLAAHGQVAPAAGDHVPAAALARATSRGPPRS